MNNNILVSRGSVLRWLRIFDDCGVVKVPFDDPTIERFRERSIITGQGCVFRLTDRGRDLIKRAASMGWQ